MQDRAYIARSVTVLNGACIEADTELRINAVVQVNTRVPQEETVPISWSPSGTRRPRIQQTATTKSGPPNERWLHPWGKALGRLGRMADVLLMADPRVARVPVQDCREPLVDLHMVTSVRLDDRKRDSCGHFARLRRGVGSRLEQATTALPDGLSLLVVEGYRPPQLQVRYFTGYRAKLAAAHPDWSESQLDAAASRYVSPPAVAPHCAGAAVDLTLCTSEGRELDMGTQVDATPEDSKGGCYTDAKNISAAARLNRGILIGALRAVGLVNYPTEWWHWSYGDRYWAIATGARAACYGPTEPSR